MTITGICGDIGSGKSVYQLDYALRQCNQKHKKLVCNFSIDLHALKVFAYEAKLPYLIWMADNNQIATIPSLNSLTELFTYPDSVVCLDEAGIFLNAREFSKTPKGLLSDLAQSRKSAIDLVYAAQFDDQVDRQFRLLTQYFVHCDSLTKYDPATRRPKLHWKYYSHFKAAAYWRWVGDYRARCSAIRTYMSAFETTWGFLTKSDKLLFNVFDSFSRLDSQGSKIKYIPSVVNDCPSTTISIFRSSVVLRNRMQTFHALPLHRKLKFPDFFAFYFKNKKHYDFTASPRKR